MQHLGHSNNRFIAYLKFKFYWVFFSGWDLATLNLTLFWTNNQMILGCCKNWFLNAATWKLMATLDMAALNNFNCFQMLSEHLGLY